MLPSPLGVWFYGSLSQQQRDYLKCGLENVLRMSPTRSLLCVLLGGADPVMRRVWTLACDCETRRCAAILRPVLPRAVGGAMSYVAAQQLRAFDLWQPDRWAHKINPV